MNTANQTARRYHWHSEKITDLVCEPHSGIASQVKVPVLDLSAKESTPTRDMSTELVQGSYAGLINDIKIIRRQSSRNSQMVSLEADDKQLTFLSLSGNEFYWHPVLNEDFSKSKYLEKVLAKACEARPKNYEQLLAMEGVGPKTMRALSLVSEVIYGAKPSYEDPARYSFAHGGKDATPYPVDRKTYDTSIQFFSRLVAKTRLPYTEKKEILARLVGR
jgi:hypothetical protein